MDAILFDAVLTFLDQAAKPPTLGMILKRGACRVHVQFGLQSLLKKARRSLNLRRLDSSGDDVARPTVAVVQDARSTQIVVDTQASNGQDSPIMSPVQRQESIRSRSPSPPPSRSPSQKVELSPTERAKLAEEERKRVEEAKTRAKKRRRAKHKADASQYVTCCRPEKNADGTSSEIGMSIFAQFPDRCNICGKQLRRKKGMVRSSRHTSRPVSPPSEKNDASTASNGDADRPEDAQIPPLHVIVHGEPKASVKIRTSNGRMVTPDGGVPGFLRGTAAWDDAQATTQTSKAPPTQETELAKPKPAKVERIDRKAYRKNPDKFFRPQTPKGASREAANSWRAGAFLPDIQRHEEPKKAAPRRTGGTTKLPDIQTRDNSEEPEYFIGSKHKSPSTSSYTARPYHNARVSAGGYHGSGAFLSTSSPNPRLERRERGWKAQTGTAAMARERGHKGRHGIVVNRPEGYELIPNFSMKESYSSTSPAKKKFHRTRDPNMKTYTQSHRSILGQFGASTQNAELEAELKLRQRQRVAQRAKANKHLVSRVEEIQRSTVAASPKSVQALQGAQALLDKGLISQVEFDAIKHEVLSIVAAEAHAMATSYGGTVRLGQSHASKGNKKHRSKGSQISSSGPGSRSVDTKSTSSSAHTGRLIGRRPPTNQELRIMQNRQTGKPSMLLKAFVGAQSQHEDSGHRSR